MNRDINQTHFNQLADSLLPSLESQPKTSITGKEKGRTYSILDLNHSLKTLSSVEQILNPTIPEEKESRILQKNKKIVSENLDETPNKVLNIRNQLLEDLSLPSHLKNEINKENEPPNREIKTTLNAIERIAFKPLGIISSDSETSALSEAEARKLRKEEKRKVKADRSNAAKKRSMSPEEKKNPPPTTLKLGTRQAINQFRCSQDSIADKSTDGIDLFEAIKEKGWKSSVSIMAVEMPDGGYTSLDKRRLYAIKKKSSLMSQMIFLKTRQSQLLRSIRMITLQRKSKKRSLV